MALVVQKFGGTSVADVEKMRRCAERVAERREAGNDLVAVVSAMGGTTDELLDLSQRVSERPCRRELDALLATGEQASAALFAMTLQQLEVDAISLAGAQTGLATDAAHTRARIAAVNTAGLREAIDAGKVPVVAGFQGVTETGEITTLGRGGSDTTAVAIAAALEASVCEIYTDVDGVYTADARIVPDARRLERISYDQMLELASLGAGVLNPRAAMCAQIFNVPIHVRHSHKPDPGTLVGPETPEMEQIDVSGAALASDIGRITLTGVPNTPGSAEQVFTAVADAGLFVDDIVQTEAEDGSATISFTAARADLADVGPVAQQALERLGGGDVRVDVGLAKVSVVGVGMRSHTGVAAKMFEALGQAGVNIRNITTSEIKISCIVDKADGEKGLRAVHDAFELHSHPQKADALIQRSAPAESSQ